MAEQTSWKYNPNASEGNASPAPSPKVESVSWEASEYVDHAQGGSWYGMLFLGTLAIAAVVWLITRDYLATGTIVVLGIIVGVAAGRKPRQIVYEVSTSGIRIGEKNYNFTSFRSFSFIQEGGIKSISLLPLKRFMPPISIYYEPGDEEKIVDIIGDHLPYEERQADAFDRLTRRLRF